VVCWRRVARCPPLRRQAALRRRPSVRYLEDLKNPEVAEWFKGQNASTRSVLARISGRDALLARIRELDHSTPARLSYAGIIPGGRYFYVKMLPTGPVGKLYVRDGLDGKERRLLDPAKYPAPEGSHNAINYVSPSMDGKLVAVGVSPGGSEDSVIRTFEVETDKEFPETIDRGWWGYPSWMPDNHSSLFTRMQKLEPGQPPTDRELNTRTPVLLRVDYAGGHGLGSTKEQVEEEMADDWRFLFWQFGVDGFQPGNGR